METAICFAHDIVKFVCGEAKGEQVKLTHWESLQLPEGVLINGVITDEERLREILYPLRQQNKIGKRIRIAIDSSDILTKTVTVPFLKPAQLRLVAEREFGQLASYYEEQLFDYAVLESRVGEEKQGRILCCAMSRALLESYKGMFQRMGCTLASCDISLNCVIKAVGLLSSARKESLLLVSVDNPILTCYLFSEGKYLFSNRFRLLAAPGTQEFGTEAAGYLSSINQFYQSERRSAVLDHAYFYGLSEEEMEPCRRAASFLPVPLEVLPETGRLVCEEQTGRERFAFGRYLTAIGCLLGK